MGDDPGEVQDLSMRAKWPPSCKTNPLSIESLNSSVIADTSRMCHDSYVHSACGSSLEEELHVPGRRSPRRHILKGLNIDVVTARIDALEAAT